MPINKKYKSLGRDDDILSVLQLSDSFFPTGMYTTSSGLEALFYKNKQQVTEAKDLQDLITVYLEQQIGPADCAALGNSFTCAKKNDIQQLLEVDRSIFSIKLVEEVRNASVRSGGQLVRCVHAFKKDDKILGAYHTAIEKKQATGIYPVALGVVSNSLGITKQKAGVMMLYSFSVSMVGAALRLGMLDHFAAQKLLHNLKPSIYETVDKNIDRPLSGIWQFAPGIDILQTAHEQMDSKMFIT